MSWLLPKGTRNHKKRREEVLRQITQIGRIGKTIGAGVAVMENLGSLYCGFLRVLVANPSDILQTPLYHPFHPRYQRFLCFAVKISSHLFFKQLLAETINALVGDLTCRILPLGVREPGKAETHFVTPFGVASFVDSGDEFSTAR